MLPVPVPIGRPHTIGSSIRISLSTIIIVITIIIIITIIINSRIFIIIITTIIIITMIVGIIIFFAVKVKLIVKLLLQLVTLPLKEHIDPVHEVSFLLFSDTEPKSVKDDVLHLLTRCLFQQRSFHDCLVRLQEAKVQNDAALKSDRGRTQKVKPREKWKGSA